MRFKEIVQRQRETYLRQLTEFYATRTTGAKEILLEMNGEEKERMFKLYRLDYCEQVNGEGKPAELAPDTYVSHSPVNYTLGQLNIELNPFYWHGCEFVLDKETNGIDWLKNWIKKWIDEEDSNPIDSSGFSNVIHSVTRPANKENGLTFSVDFGTATEDCFIDLLDEIEKQEIMKIRIGSFSMIH
jgi:hypothetical protein